METKEAMLHAFASSDHDQMERQLNRINCCFADWPTHNYDISTAGLFRQSSEESRFGLLGLEDIPCSLFENGSCEKD